MNLYAGVVSNRNVLLATSSGEPLVTELSLASGSSKVIVVANSSIVSNLGLLDSGNRLIASKLIDKFSGATVGFLTGDKDPEIVTNNSNRQSGIEFLTVWPFNVISIHTALLAMIAVIALFPIFGRAKKAPVTSTADFGDHVEAVGELLRRTNDRQFAINAIVKYFRVVRRDTKSSWSNMDPTTTSVSGNIKAD